MKGDYQLELNEKHAKFERIFHLHGFIEPSIGRVASTAAAVDHLKGAAGVISVLMLGRLIQFHIRIVEKVSLNRLVAADDHACRLDAL